MDIENYQILKNPQLYEKHDISYYFLSSVNNKMNKKVKYVE